MEVDFMAQRVPFLSKLCFFILLLAACKSETAITIPVYKWVQADDPSIQQVNGVVFVANELFTGSIFSFFPETEDTASITAFKEGKEHGCWVKYYPNKQLREKRFFDQGKKTGDYMAYWENGQLQLQYIFVNDEYEGTCKEWSAEGLLTREMNFVKGHEEGHQQWWYDNGKVKANYIIKDGRRYGLLGTKNCVNVSDSVFTN